MSTHARWPVRHHIYARYLGSGHIEYWIHCGSDTCLPYISNGPTSVPKWQVLTISRRGPQPLRFFFLTTKRASLMEMKRPHGNTCNVWRTSQVDKWRSYRWLTAIIVSVIIAEHFHSMAANKASGYLEKTPWGTRNCAVKRASYVTRAADASLTLSRCSSKM